MYQIIIALKNEVNLQSFTCFQLLLIIKGFINTARAEEVKTYNLVKLLCIMINCDP